MKIVADYDAWKYETNALELTFIQIVAYFSIEIYINNFRMIIIETYF